MTHTKVPGPGKESLSVCLLPTGSAREKTRGISHLFEHILIAKISGAYKTGITNGYTTEDYVIIFSANVNSAEVMQILRKMSFEKEEIGYHKQILLQEIERKSVNGEEAFFSFVWQGTVYEKSPLGTAAEVKMVTPAMLEDLREEILKQRLFFYNPAAGLEIVNGHRYRPHPRPGFDIPRSRSKTFRGKHYDIFYFENCVESCYLLVKILKNLNPGKHIQLSEKKEMSALILEKGTTFPGKHNIEPLRKEARQQLDRDISEIKANKNEIALNELESFYFYGKHWQDRIAELDKTEDRQLLDLAGKLSGM